MKMWLENYGHWGFPAEFLQYGGLCDEIAGEFWVGSRDFLNQIDTNVGYGWVAKVIGIGDFLNQKDTTWNGRYELRDASSAANIYFVANPQDKSLTTTAAFRVANKAPELWWPDSGRIERPAVYDAADGVVRLPLTFGPAGSVFVVFRDKAAPPATRIVSVMRNGQEILGTTVKPVASDDANRLPLQLTRNSGGRIITQGGAAGDYELKFADGQTRPLKISAEAPPVEIAGPWDVSFAPGRGAPEKIALDQLADWTKRPEDGIKHFSGKATYRRSFAVPAPRQPGTAMILDLGQVNDIAVVRVNGKELATLWMPPYRFDITAAVKPGANTLEVDVVNTWNNRLAGDAALPAEQRCTSITAATVTKDTPLLPAGLVGPVYLRDVNTTLIK